MGGTKRKGFKSISLLSNPRIPEVLSISVGDFELVHTGDIRAGNHVSFSVKTDPIIILLSGKSMSLNSLGVADNTPIQTVKAVLRRCKLCRGAPGGKTLWTHAFTNESYKGNISKNCALILEIGCKVCSSCASHKRYLSNITNVSKSAPSQTQTAVFGDSAEPPVSDCGLLVCPDAPDESSNTEGTTEEKLFRLSGLLSDLGVPPERASLLIESVKNDAAIEKGQRRWTSRYLK